MKRFMLLSAIAIAFAATSFGAIQISVNGGYSYSNMDSLNKYWEKVKVDAAAYTTTSTANWKAYGNGIFGNLDLGFNMNKNLLLGVRTGVQYIFPSEYSGFRAVNIPPVIWMPTDTIIDNYLIPVMAGLNLYMPLGDDSALAINAAAYAGWGLAYCSQTTSYNGSEPLLALYGTNGFVADLSAAVELKLLPFLTVSINGGYRFAKMTDFKNINKVSATVPGYGLITVPSNDPFNDNSGKPVAVDFSGIMIGAGVNLRF